MKSGAALAFTSLSVIPSRRADWELDSSDLKPFLLFEYALFKNPLSIKSFPFCVSATHQSIEL